MAEPEPDRNVIIEHPNRDKAVVKATKGVVIFLLLVSVLLMLIVTIGGWSTLVGLQPVQIGFMVVYLLLAFYAARWNRGVLPVAAALAIILLIFAAVAGPAWFARDKPGFAQPDVPSNVLGLITLLLVPVQVLLIAFSMRGFQHDWHVEVERPVDGGRDGGRGREDRFTPGDPGPQPA